jgi:hypothetical protein
MLAERRDFRQRLDSSDRHTGYRALSTFGASREHFSAGSTDAFRFGEARSRAKADAGAGAGSAHDARGRIDVPRVPVGQRVRLGNVTVPYNTETSNRGHPQLAAGILAAP